MGGKAVRLGVIGGGIWGTYHLRAARELEREGKVQLVALAARTQATVDRQAEAFGIKGYTDYRQLLAAEALDAVTVATPDHLHREMTLQALQHGLHVFVEKPLDLTTAGCQEMVAAAAARDLLLQVDLHKRYDPYNIEVRRQVQAGKIGEPYYAHAYMENQIVVPAEWLASWAAETTPFWFIGVHKFDFVRWVTSQEAVSVRAFGRRGKLAAQGIATFDAITAQIEMDGGLTCTVEVCWVLPRQFEAVVNQGLRIVGSEGLIELDSQNRGLRYCFSDEGALTPNYGALFADESVFGGERLKGYFVDAIKDFLYNVMFLKAGGELAELAGRYPSGLDGLRITQLAEAVHLSIAEKRTVALAELANGLGGT